MSPEAIAKPKLVIGANGFLGSHVTRRLVADGAEVRAMVRPTAKTRGIDDLELVRFHGDVFDTDTLREAMDGVDDVYYCVVDTRAWLRDPSPLFHTNVEGLRNVLDIAKDAGLQRFIFTSTYATVDRRHGHVATEADRIGNRRVSPYVQSRVQAEDLVLRYADHGYVLENGRIAAAGTAAELKARDDVAEFYLGSATAKTDVTGRDAAVPTHH